MQLNTLSPAGLRQLEGQLQAWQAAPVAATLSKDAALSLLAGASGQGEASRAAGTQKMTDVLLDKVSPQTLSVWDVVIPGWLDRPVPLSVCLSLSV